MKYDWISLKRKFITKCQGDKKYTLKQFAEDEKISYSLVRKNSCGWIDERETKQEQRNNKITEKTIERQIESFVEMNSHHYDLANKLFEVMEKTFSEQNLIKSPKSINTLSKALLNLQNVQRTASGADKTNGGAAELIQEFIKAVQDENSDKPI